MGPVSFAALALVGVVALLGPLLTLPRRLRVPVVVGELLAGLLVGATGLGLVDAREPTFAFLGQVGFALVMFLVGTNVPVRDPALRRGAGRGLLRAALAGVLAVPLAAVLSAAFGTGHTGLYAVLFASSSAALVLPVLDGVTLPARERDELLTQVAVADAATIVALPLVLEPDAGLRAGVGVLVVGASGVVVFLLLRTAERRGARRRLHRVSEKHRLALELRVSLMLLFAVAALALAVHVSVLLAGFTLGLAVAGVGEPRRLARQVFGLTEGFLGPLFFVWLGASLDLRAVASHPSSLVLGLALGLGALAVHAVGVLTGQPGGLAVLSGAQLGVPVAAVTLAGQLGVLAPGEGVSLLVGALVTIGAVSVVGARLGRAAHPADTGGGGPDVRA